LPLIKNSSGELAPAEWEDALVRVAQALKSGKGKEVGAIVGGQVDAEVWILDLL
jgi:NADH dehydrogenase (ubiquinone) Fe-S protein 1